MVRPTLEEAHAVDVSRYRLIPLSCEMYADMITPLEVMRILKGISTHCFILESAEDARNWGRYTFLGFDPKMEVTCREGVMRIVSKPDQPEDAETFTTDNPHEHITRILDNHVSMRYDYLPSFTGGLVGYFSYDYAKYSDAHLKIDAYDEEQFNDVDLMLFHNVIAFDHYRHKIVLITNIGTDDLENNYQKGLARLESLKALLKTKALKRVEDARITSKFTQLFDEDRYGDMVRQAQERIEAGELSQVVLSNRFTADFEGSLFDTYRVLRAINPSPYMFYFSGDDVEIAGASPETLVKLLDGTLYTFPLAGTRRRGATEEEDQALEVELLADKKEQAEHNMLVELGISDLSKVSKFGTVFVEKFQEILRFSHVMHIGSTIRGQIQEGKSGLDALTAVLPAGTLSGAPKTAAMHTIHELERSRRGIYGGAIGYLDFAGNMDVCIAIRIAYKKNGKVFVRSGAGIVAESNPATEYQECLNKAAAVLDALEQSSAGLD